MEYGRVRVMVDIIRKPIEAIVNPPEDYTGIADTIMSNLDHSIDEVVAKRLKAGKLVAQYAAWNFCGTVWFCKKRKQWACMVDRYRVTICTIFCDTLQEIMDECCRRFGSE